MEWYTLDDNLRRDAVIEGFQSFIWTERYSDLGDFQIVTKSTLFNKTLLRTGVWIGMKESDRIMKIESVNDKTEDDGKKNLIITGRSFESILQDRVAMPLLGDLTTTPKWEITGTPIEIAQYIFDQICVLCVLDPNDTIPFYTPGTLLPPGGIPEPNEIVTITFDPSDVFNNIKQICDIWLLGFRFVKNGDAGEIYFEIYTGTDRTSGQTDIPAVIFSPDLESFDKTSVLSSIAAQKTVAYVFAKNAAIIVYADGYDSSVSGADRRVVLVKADDIDLPAGPDLDAAMIQKGREELAKWRKIYAIDGELPKNVSYVYGIDYKLGDLIEERNPDGGANYLLVTEQIFVSDHEGERSYPTLVLEATLVPGAWDTFPPDEHWGDVDSETHWADL